MLGRPISHLSSLPPFRSARRSMKVVRLRAHPGDKRRNLGLGPQRIDIRQPTLELLLRKQRVDHVVAERVKQHLRPKRAAARFRDQVVLGLARRRRDQSLAERAARRLVGSGLNFLSSA